MIKPRITRVANLGYWKCASDAARAYGETPTAAYRAWRIKYDWMIASAAQQKEKKAA